MGATKTDIFTERQRKLSTIAKALAHPARIAILEYLLETKSCICGDVVEEIGLAQATVSQHLKELKNAGIIKGSSQGTCVCYCINEENWATIQSELESFIKNISIHCSCC